MPILYGQGLLLPRELSDIDNLGLNPRIMFGDVLTLVIGGKVYETFEVISSWEMFEDSLDNLWKLHDKTSLDVTSG